MSQPSDFDARRPEGRPFPWWSLIDQHRAALKKTLRLLKSAVERLPEPREPGDRGEAGTSRRVQRGRASQLAFLDGGRGTGKTSVELSLRRAFEPPYRGDDGGMIEMTAIPPGMPASDPRRKDVDELKELAKKVNGHLVWLAPLDMEPLPEGVNLVAALLVRLEELLREDLSRGKDRGGWLARADRDERAAQRLEQLRTDVVKAWDGGMRSRSARQNIHAWADEVWQAEKARLDLNTRLAVVLDELAWQWKRGGRENPLFIMVVDDFDLNPTLCVELLRVVRMITTPRLFFIMAGDLEMVADVMHLKTAGSAQALLSLPTAEPEFVGRIKHMASTVAASNLRKLVPPGQRVPLTAMSVDEATAVYLPGESAAGGGGEQATRFDDRTFRQLLEETRLRTRGPRRTLAELLLGVYRDYLRVPVRTLMDTAMDLRALTLGSSGEVDAAALIDALVDEVRRRIDEASIYDVPDSLRQPLQSALAEGRLGDLCRVTLQTNNARYLQVEDHELFPVSAPQWSGGLDGAVVALPRPLGAGFSLVHDVGVMAGGQPDDQLLGGVHRHLGQVKYQFGHQDAYIRWPTLRWPQIGQAIDFAVSWSQAVESRPTPAPLQSWLEAWYALEAKRVGLEDADDLASNVQRLFRTGVDDAPDGRDAPQWLAVAPQAGLWDRCIDAALMLAPEMRWRTPVASLTGPGLDRFAHAAAHEIRRRRVERLGEMGLEGARLLPVVSPRAWLEFRKTARAMVGQLRAYVRSLLPGPGDHPLLTELEEAWADLHTFADGRTTRRHPNEATQQLAQQVPVILELVDQRSGRPRDWVLGFRAQLRSNFAEPWQLLFEAEPQAKGGFNALADGMLCPALDELQQALNWPAFAQIDL